LTFDNFGMRRPWRRFVEELGYEVEFLHRDELAEEHDIADVSLPAAFILHKGALSLWIKSETMDSLHSLDELQLLVTQKLTQGVG
jgi:hypothetical protein